MLLTTALSILFIFLRARNPTAQNAYSMSNNPVFVDDSVSGIYARPTFQSSGSSAPLSKEMIFQLPNTPSNLFLKPTTISSGSASSSQISPAMANPSPVDIFRNTVKEAVYSSQTLTNIFDLSQFSPEAFSRSLYDYVYASGSKMGYSNPHYIANTAATPLKEGIAVLTLPKTLDIYASAIGKFLFAKGVLNPSNAETLGLKYVKIMEDTAERSWVKDIPESKFLVLEDGFRIYMESLYLDNVNTVEDLVLHFGREVKRVATLS